MRTIKWNDSADPWELSKEIASVLQEGGLACMPCAGRYRIFAVLHHVDAVMQLMRSKGRVSKAPALVFIDGEEQLSTVAEEIDPVALQLGRALWPQPLTIRVLPSPELPKKVFKQLGGAKSRIGVRIPSEPLVRAVVASVGSPLLVSSANRERKSGASSPAQVRKTFANQVDLFVDQGDLSPGAVSTVVDVRDGKVKVERPGAISDAQLAEHQA
ncbi:MAG: L-threonylcarbamoyladenylate synthase [Deltaproteobacteria bacterium]|nr:L-threonylcarbamoyladenylate synthase [Deltaproteobacteria bacterium]MBW2537912.1 L-threonylcarbamoyladenylate synthase [Deltaproteobacteria bacterium]